MHTCPHCGLNTKLRPVFADSKAATAKLIKRMTCIMFDMNMSELESKSRKAELVKARHIAMYMIRNFCRLPVASIGEMFGGRDHATVIHAIGRCKDSLEIKSDLYSDMMELEAVINEMLSPKLKAA